MKFIKINDESGKFLTWRIVNDDVITVAEQEENTAAINNMQMLVIFCNYFQLPMSDLMELLRYNGENYEGVT